MRLHTVLAIHNSYIPHEVVRGFEPELAGRGEVKPVCCWLHTECPAQGRDLQMLVLSRPCAAQLATP